MYSEKLCGGSGVLEKDLHGMPLRPLWDPEKFNSTKRGEEMRFMACVYSKNLNGNI
jgi:hypothetical protein